MGQNIHFTIIMILMSHEIKFNVYAHGELESGAGVLDGNEGIEP